MLYAGKEEGAGKGLGIIWKMDHMEVQIFMMDESFKFSQVNGTVLDMI